MLTTSTIVVMASIGVASAIAEKLCQSFGKGDIAQFMDIASKAGVGSTALAVVIKVLQQLKSV